LNLPAGGKVIGKTAIKALGKVVWIYTVLDLTNRAVNYIEHGDTNDMEVGGDISSSGGGEYKTQKKVKGKQKMMFLIDLKGKDQRKGSQVSKRQKEF